MNHRHLGHEGIVHCSPLSESYIQRALHSFLLLLFFCSRDILRLKHSDIFDVTFRRKILTFWAKHRFKQPRSRRESCGTELARVSDQHHKAPRGFMLLLEIEM